MISYKSKDEIVTEAERECPVCGKKMKFHKLATIRMQCEDLVELELLTRPDNQGQKY